MVVAVALVAVLSYSWARRVEASPRGEAFWFAVWCLLSAVAVWAVADVVASQP